MEPEGSLGSPGWKTSPIWGITSFFNPMGYRRRLENFRVFRDRLELPVLAVELGYGGEFELDAPDAEIIVQIRGRDVLDQKERLLNLALGHLPPECESVVWLDCDLVFLEPNWVAATHAALRHQCLVQPFSRVHYLDPGSNRAGTVPGAGQNFRQGLAFLVDKGRPFPDVYNDETFRRAPGSASPGHVWAARREVLDHHGFYDACIVGGADSAMNCAAYGDFDRVMRYHRMNAAQQRHYLRWARPFHETVRGRVTHVAGEVLHLWHGSIRDRRTEDNYAAIQPFGFDPEQDLAVGASGCWEWNSDKPLLHARVHDYFAGRNEDA